MGFHTPEFLILASLAWVLFGAARRKAKIWLLGIFDALFFLHAGLLDLGVLLAASACACASAKAMGRSCGRRRKIAFFLGLAVNILNLGFFKYYHFIIGNLSGLASMPGALTSLRVVLPVGISFYTFQLIAYLVDVYREDVQPISSFIEFWVFISFFGQVVAGPIMRAGEFAPQVARTDAWKLDGEELKKALFLFVLGLSKKLVLADSLAPFVDRHFAKGTAMSSIDLWISAYLFGFQIYYDFSAYSDMALGIGRLFGYRLAPNFKSPYLSRNPAELWQRWHITLSRWIRDYLYIPMGGSRKGFGRGLLAVVASMCISGLWHGASWNFVLWGFYHGILVAAHRVWNRTAGRLVRRSCLTSAVSWCVFLQLTMVGWVIFRIQATKDLFVLLGKMLTFSDLGRSPHVLHYALAIVALCLLHVIENAVRKNGPRLWSWWFDRVPDLARGLVYAVVVLALCLFLRPRPNAFIYFQF